MNKAANLAECGVLIRGPRRAQWSVPRKGVRISKLEDENEEINKHNLDRSFNLQLAKRGNDGAYFLLGLTVTVFVIVARFTSFVIPLHRQWALIVVRVAGSWIAASGLLMLGWALYADCGRRLY
jgi:hypothetical protein